MKRKTKNIMQTLTDILAIISALFVLWTIISWIDVVIHNLDPEPVYQAWNLFTLLF